MPINKNPYLFFEEYILRVPLFPLDICPNIGKKKTLSKDDIQLIWGQPKFKEALYLASPKFYGICLNYFEGNPKKRDHRIEASLLKYMIRGSSRSTPFGLFAAQDRY